MNVNRRESILSESECEEIAREVVRQYSTMTIGEYVVIAEEYRQAKLDWENRNEPS